MKQQPPIPVLIVSKVNDKNQHLEDQMALDLTSPTPHGLQLMAEL
jgi:hypothetical protein